MNDFLNTVMNFINENTTLLIIICVFLIFVLVGYLIDNSVKSRKMAKKREQGLNNEVVVEEATIETPVDQPIEQEVTIEQNDVVEPIQPIAEEIQPEPEVQETIIPEPIQVEEDLVQPIELSESEPLDDIKTTNFDDIDYEEPNVDITPDIMINEEVEPSPALPEENTEPTTVEANEISIDPEINDLLSRDFTSETESFNNIDESSAISNVIKSI